MEIIGIGCSSALGNAEAFRKGLKEGGIPKPAHAFSQEDLKDTLFYQGDLSDSDAVDIYAMSLAAISDALDDANVDSKNVALVFATGAGDTTRVECEAPARNTYDTATLLSEHFGWEGVVITVSNACSSSAYAVTVCEDLLCEDYDAVILCGAEAKSITTQATFKAMMVLDSLACRPHSIEREGTILGSGAAALVLVNRDKNQSLGQSAYAKITANTLTCDAYHPTAPDPSGEQLRRCIEMALDKSQCKAEDISYFVPHATGTPLNDDIEKNIFSGIFDKKFSSSSTYLLKSFIGHTGGASAAFSLILGAQIIASRKVQVGGKNSDKNSEEKETYVLITSSAFGGTNSCTILKNSEISTEMCA